MEQKQSREAISEDLLGCIEEDPAFLGNAITGNETLSFDYDP